MNQHKHDDTRPLDYESKSPKRSQRFAIVLASTTAIVIMVGCALHWYWGLELGLAVNIMLFAFVLIGIPAGIYYGTQDKEYWQ